MCNCLCGKVFIAWMHPSIYRLGTRPICLNFEHPFKIYISLIATLLYISVTLLPPLDNSMASSSSVNVSTAAQHKSSTQAEKSSTDLKQWEHYVTYRPRWPDSMWKMWLHYHQGLLVSAHDIGTGSGNAAEDLLQASIVHSPPGLRYLVLTDLRESNIQDARTRFLSGKRFPETKFAFRVAPAESSWQDIAERIPEHASGIDFIMACESIHWTDLEPTLRNVVTSLRPGGTFAAALYWPFPIISGNEKARQAFNRLVDKRVAQIQKDQWMNAAWVNASRQMNLDVVPLRGEMWRDVKRIYVHCGRQCGGWAWEQHPEEKDWHAESALHLGDYERIELADHIDWKMNSNVEWLRGLLESLRFGFSAESWESEEWCEIEEASGIDGNINLEWQVQMILARKR